MSRVFGFCSYSFGDMANELVERCLGQLVVGVVWEAERPCPTEVTRHASERSDMIPHPTRFKVTTKFPAIYLAQTDVLVVGKQRKWRGQWPGSLNAKNDTRTQIVRPSARAVDCTHFPARCAGKGKLKGLWRVTTARLQDSRVGLSFKRFWQFICMVK